MVKEPQVHRHHIVDEHKIALLFPSAITTVVGKQFHMTFFAQLVKLVKRHAGHAAFVLLPRTVDIEVAKTHHLGGVLGKVSAHFAAHPLVKQELGVAVNIQRFLMLRGFHKAARSPIGGGR